MAWYNFKKNLEEYHNAEPLVIPNPSRKISYSQEFNFYLKKYSHLSFFKKYLKAYAETSGTDFIVVVNGKSYYYREIILENPKLSRSEINKILELSNLKTKVVIDEDGEHIPILIQPKKITSLNLQ